MRDIPGSQQLKGFIEYLLENPSCLFPIAPEKIADSLRCYFGLRTPLELPDIFKLFDDMGIKITTRTSFPGRVRGFHQILGNRIEVMYLENEWEGGIAHTLFHELLEVIIELIDLYLTSNSEIVVSEYNANLFAASVLMPRDEFLLFAVKANFDIELIRQKYYLAYFSLLIRLNYLLSSNCYYVGYTVTNYGTYPHKKSDDENEEYDSFKITESTKDAAEVPYKYYFKIAYNAIFEQEEEKSSVRFLVRSEYGHENLLVATPVLNRRNRVRQIIIHVMDYSYTEQLKKQFRNAGLRQNREIIEDILDGIYEGMGEEFTKKIS